MGGPRKVLLDIRTQRVTCATLSAGLDSAFMTLILELLQLITRYPSGTGRFDYLYIHHLTVNSRWRKRRNLNHNHIWMCGRYLLGTPNQCQ
jgi:hypothetical protein